MAGSYNHCVDPDGRLLNPRELVGMIENGGDVYEAIEEMYGMIWWLASIASSPGVTVEVARGAYKTGLALSPGVNGSNPKED